MSIRNILLALVASSAMLTGCAVRPAFDPPPPSVALTPYQFARSPEAHVDQPVMWGGMVIEVKNFEHHSEVEILAFPLNAQQQPILKAPDQGRFIALMAGFADPATLPVGRYVTLHGTLTGDRRGDLRGEPYIWPEVDVKRMHLWPADFNLPRSRISIGVGVGIH